MTARDLLIATLHERRSCASAVRLCVHRVVMSQHARSFARNDALPAGKLDRENFAPFFAQERGPRIISRDVRMRIARERGEGVSYWRIAKRLNAEGVECARGGKRWTQGVVWQALQVGKRTNAVNQPLCPR